MEKIVDTLEERTLLELRDLALGIRGSAFLIKNNRPHGAKTLELMEERLDKLKQNDIYLESVKMRMGVDAPYLIQTYEIHINYLKKMPKRGDTFIDIIYNFLSGISKELLEAYIDYNEVLEAANKIIGKWSVSEQYKRKCANLTR